MTLRNWWKKLSPYDRKPILTLQLQNIRICNNFLPSCKTWVFEEVISMFTSIKTKIINFSPQKKFLLSFVQLVTVSFSNILSVNFPPSLQIDTNISFLFCQPSSDEAKIFEQNQILDLLLRGGLNKVYFVFRAPASK